MRIAFLAHYAGAYGANRSLLTLVLGLAERGASPYVVVPQDGAFTTQLKQAGIEHYVLPFAPGMAPTRRLWRAIPQATLNIRMRRPLAGLLAETSADLVYSNSGLIAMGAQAALDLQLPHIWHLREMPRQAFGMHYQGGEQHVRALQAQTATFIAVSNVVRKTVLPQPLAPRCAVVYNGVFSAADMERLYPINLDGATHSPPRFAMLGSINPNKNQMLAIRALTHLPPSDGAELWIAGTGGRRYVARLQRLTRQWGIDARVRFCGFVEDSLELYRLATAVVVCTTSEGMGRVTAEAMALGLPVIGYNSSGTAELIEDEVTGLLFDGRPEHLAQQMGRILHEKGLAERLRLAAWQQASRHFTIERYCDTIWSICRTSLEQWRG